MALVQAQQRRSAIKTKLASRRVMLDTFWGSETVDVKVWVGSLYAFELDEPFKILYQRVAESPTLEAFATDECLRDAELQLARSQASSNGQ